MSHEQTTESLSHLSCPYTGQDEIFPAVYRFCPYFRHRLSPKRLVTRDYSYEEYERWRAEHHLAHVLGARNRQPVVVHGVAYPSKAEARRQLGFSVHQRLPLD